ncbi:MAG: hypothetical protein LBV02_05670 [Bacteroidales bacterium]|jgi:hypothetical protein|nr:hypothetical protein [Bacteroidales bacterium]
MKLFTAMVAMALIAGVTVFYACEKEGKNNNSEKNLVKESEFVARNYDGVCLSEFVARNYDGVCLQVDVFRDEDNNAQCVFNAVADDPKITGGFIVSEKLDLKPKQKMTKVSPLRSPTMLSIGWFLCQAMNL